MKVLFFDADGTIIRHSEFHEPVKNAILLLRDHDVLPVLSTGRSMPQINLSVKSAGSSGYDHGRRRLCDHQWSARLP